VAAFRGHLDNISDNIYLGAVNAFAEADGHGKDGLDGEVMTLPRDRPRLQRARHPLGGHRRRELRRGLVPRARRHGAPPPGRPGHPVRSFARIHETNLKKQGMLPLTFADPADYDKVRDGDRPGVFFDG
jgi:aconitate hydratase